MYKVVEIWPGLFVSKQVTVCPGHIWTTLYLMLKHWQIKALDVTAWKSYENRCWHPATIWSELQCPNSTIYQSVPRSGRAPRTWLCWICHVPSQWNHVQLGCDLWCWRHLRPAAILCTALFALLPYFISKNEIAHLSKVIYRVVQARIFQTISLSLGALAKLRKANISFVMSVRLSLCPSAWNKSAPAGRILMKFDICAFFENLSWKYKFLQNLTRITGTLQEDVSSFMIFCWILFKMRNILDVNWK
jgi:hypothetical protein